MSTSFRIGAIHTMKGKVVEFFGYGTYLGDEIPPSNITFLGRIVTDETPKLLLDSGETIWGFECWWGDVDHINREMEGKEIVNVNITEIRGGSNVKG